MKRILWLPIVATSCYCSASFAGDIEMRGFASFVGGMTGGADELYDGHDNHFNVRPDSLIALQFDADLEEGLRATVQLTSKGITDYEANIEWAYLTYEFNDSLQLSAGKIRIPFYRYSDFLDVRYTYNWIEAPKEVYGFDFSNFDGMSFLHTSDFAGWDSSLQLVYGQYDGDISGAEANIEDMIGLSWSLNRDWLTLRASYFESNVTIAINDFDPLVQAVEGVGSGFSQDLSYISDDIIVDSDTGAFMGLAVGIDFNNILIDAEYIEYQIEDSLIPKTKGYYVSLGYRFESVVPYITQSYQKADPEDNLSGQVPASIAPIPAIPAPGGNITLPQMLAGAVAGTEIDTEALEVGIRYDFHHSAALKASYLTKEDIAGYEITLFRVGVDMVF